MQGELHKWRLRDAYSNVFILPQLNWRKSSYNLHSAIDSIDQPTASLVAAQNSQNWNRMTDLTKK